MNFINDDKVDNQEVGTPNSVDSGIAMANDQGINADLASLDQQLNNATIAVEYNGTIIRFAFDQITAMGNELAKARADGRFPPTKAAAHDIGAITHDFFRLVELNEARGTAPREEWNKMRNVVKLLIDITREIRARDKLTAEKSENERVKAHIDNMMSGVGAEAKLYNIVQHAVTFAVKNGSSDKAATLTGQNMADLLNGIRGVIKEMAGQGSHNINGANVEAVLEDIFNVIDFALDKNVNDLGGRVKHMDGQIMHLNAIGQHVNAIDGHVHSLGNNINSFGTLLNSTHGNVVSLTTQIALLQTIINMLPRMIADACEQMIPETVQDAMNPIIGAIAAQLGVALAARVATGVTAAAQTNKTKKFLKSLKSGFKNLFKKSHGRGNRN